MNSALSAAPMIVAVLTVLFAALAPVPALAQDQLRNKALVEQAMKAWGAGTGSPYELLDDDASWTIVGNSAASKTYPSREDFLREVIRPFNARMSVGLKPTIRQMVAEGDHVVVLFDASGIAKDNVPYSNTYSWWLEFKDGKIVRAYAFFDSIAFNDLWQRVKP
jgi:ketosteroid isomerase-like protein